LIQIDTEVMRVETVVDGGTQYAVTRGMGGSLATGHQATSHVYHLLSKTEIAPFPPDFFGSPYSGSWSFPIILPCVRVASAELYVTNRVGNSPTRTVCLTDTIEKGLRTLSGRQINLAIEGTVAIEADAVPPARLSQASSVRDIFATVDQSPIGSPLSCVIRVNRVAVATLSIQPGQIVSNTIDMTSDPSVEGLVIPADQPVALDVTAVGSEYPGRRLIAIVRL
jgi:hypothetical protein